MPNTKRLRKLRRRLWEADPHCVYCGCETVWWVSGTGHADKPSNAATLDHVISRLDPRRYQMDHYPSSYFVLACDSCNNKRGAREDVTLRRKVNWNSKEQLKNILLTNPELAVQYTELNELST